MLTLEPQMKISARDYQRAEPFDFYRYIAFPLAHIGASAICHSALNWATLLSDFDLPPAIE
jgi:hypothetical protein